MSQDNSTLPYIGNFRGNIVDYKAVEGKSNTVFVSIDVQVTGYYSPETKEWQDNFENNSLIATGFLCIVKKDRQLNELACRSLIEHAGWDGTMSSIISKTWQPKPISFTHEESTYDGKTSLRIGFINDFDSTAESGGMSEEDAKKFDMQYSPQLRALSSNSPSNTPPPPPTKPRAPAKPKRPATPAAQVPAADQAQTEQPGDDIPF